MPIAWREVTDRLDPAAFTIRTVPERLARLKSDPWQGYDTLEQCLPALPKRSEPMRTEEVRTEEVRTEEVRTEATPPARSSIVVARKPAPRVK